MNIQIPPEVQSEIDLHHTEIQMYVNCMYDVIHRMNLIKEIGESQIEILSNPRDYKREFICSQFRIILELILLSSLAANQKSYLELFSKIQKEWNPSELIKKLKKANPEFYPKPLSYVMDTQNRAIGIYPSNEDYFSLKDLNSLFGLTSKHVHAHNPFAKDIDINSLKIKLQGAFVKINKLLELHIIKLKGLKKGIIFSIDFAKPYSVIPIWVTGNADASKFSFPVQEPLK